MIPGQPCIDADFVGVTFDHGRADSFLQRFGPGQSASAVLGDVLTQDFPADTRRVSSVTLADCMNIMVRSATLAQALGFEQPNGTFVITLATTPSDPTKAVGPFNPSNADVAAVFTLNTVVKDYGGPTGC